MPKGENAKALINKFKLARINLILSKNGMGKSHLMREMAGIRDASVQLSPFEKKQYPEIYYIPPNREDVAPTSYNSTNNVNIGKSYKLINIELLSQYVTRRLLSLLSKQQSDLIKRLSDASDEPHDFSKDILRPFQELFDDVELVYNYDIGQVEFKRENVKLDKTNFSSGQLELVTMAVDIYSYIDSCSSSPGVLLIDEIDLHLDQDTQERLIAFMAQKLEEPAYEAVSLVLSCHSTLIPQVICSKYRDRDMAKICLLGNKFSNETSIAFDTISEELSTIMHSLGSFPLVSAFKQKFPLLIEGPSDKFLFDLISRNLSRGSIYISIPMFGKNNGEKLLDCLNRVSEAIYQGGPINPVVIFDNDRGVNEEYIGKLREDYPRSQIFTWSCYSLESLVFTREVLTALYKGDVKTPWIRATYTIIAEKMEEQGLGPSKITEKRNCKPEVDKLPDIRAKGMHWMECLASCIKTLMLGKELETADDFKDYPALNDFMGEDLLEALKLNKTSKPPLVNSGSKSGFFSKPKNNVVNTIVTGWYTNDDIAQLLNFYINDEQTHVFTAIMGNNLEDGDTLQAQLQQYSQIRLNNIANGKTVKDNVLIPVNIGTKEGHELHWVLLKVRFPQGATQNPQVWYVDPLGNTMHQDIYDALKANFPEIKVEDITNRKIPFQKDDYNCGTWIVEIAKHLVFENRLPPEDFDIMAARQAHQQILDKLQALSAVKSTAL